MSTETLGGMFEAITRGVLPEIDAYASYWTTVVSQNADGTLELRPDNPRRTDMSKVRIFHATPGKEIRVDAGARALVQFVGGDRRMPTVTHWEAAGLKEESTKALVRYYVEAPTIELKGSTINVNGGQVRLGGPAGVEQLIKGTTYRAAEAARHTAETVAGLALTAALVGPVSIASTLAPLIQPAYVPTTADVKVVAAQLAALAAALAAYLQAMEAARSTFEAAVAAVLSTVSRTE